MSPNPGPATSIGGEFVTEYAATNTGEDLAETIAAFTLGDRPDGYDVRDAKVLFLLGRP